MVSKRDLLCLFLIISVIQVFLVGCWIVHNLEAQESLLTKLQKCQMSFEYYEKTNPNLEQLFDNNLKLLSSRDILQLNYLETQGRKIVSIVFGELNE
jgi:uncharacterized membrane protein YheB (UPF0754 family)